MKDNSTLNRAKYSCNTDEWYTEYNTIEQELKHYSQHFNKKIVLCNCDDPFKSAFAKYFLKNFNSLKLRRLICTCYNGNKNTSNDFNKDIFNNNHGYIMIIDNVASNLSNMSDEEITSILNEKKLVNELNGDGDFNSYECIKYLQDADIVVTNPPFSKFTDLFSLLVKYDKKYLLIGNQNAITYKEVFPHIKNGKAWIGYKFGDMAFMVPDDTKPRKTRFWIDENGQKWRSIGNAMWLTNLDNERKHKELKLTALYDSKKYPKYDNFDAINVTRVIDIPCDYYGIMGVPLTYLKYHNPEQFEIIGEANHGSDNEFDLFKPIVNEKQIFKRILIKRKVNK